MSSETAPSPEHDFDFWLGDWEVFGPQGQQVGTNLVTPLFGTGAIAEHWRGEGGIEGRSVNAWDALRSCWHQTWVDSSGGLLLLDGRLVDGSMVLAGVAPGVDEAPEQQRITWTPSADEVRQLWEVSADDGQTWRTAFDGRYRRRTT